MASSDIDGVLVTTPETTVWRALATGKVTLPSALSPSKHVKLCPMKFYISEKEPIKSGPVTYLEWNTNSNSTDPASPQSIHLVNGQLDTQNPGDWEDVTERFIRCFQALNRDAQKWNMDEVSGFKNSHLRTFVHWMCVKSPDEPSRLNTLAIQGWPMLKSISSDLVMKYFSTAVELASKLLQTKRGTAAFNIPLLASVALRLYAGGYKSEPFDDRSFFYSMFSIPDYQCDCDDMSMIVAAVANAVRDTQQSFAEGSKEQQVLNFLKDDVKGVYVAHGKANTPQGERMIGHVWVILTVKEPRKGLPDFEDCLLVECTTSSAPSPQSNEVAIQMDLQKRCTMQAPACSNCELAIRVLPSGEDYVTIAIYGADEAYALAYRDALGVPFNKLTKGGPDVRAIPLHDFKSPTEKMAEIIKTVNSLTTKYTLDLFSDETLLQKIKTTQSGIVGKDQLATIAPGILVPGQFCSSRIKHYQILPTVSWCYECIPITNDDTTSVIHVASQI